MAEKKEMPVAGDKRCACGCGCGCGCIGATQKDSKAPQPGADKSKQ